LSVLTRIHLNCLYFSDQQIDVPVMKSRKCNSLKKDLDLSLPGRQDLANA